MLTQRRLPTKLHITVLIKIFGWRERPGVNPPGYQTTQAKARFSGRCSLAQWLQPWAMISMPMCKA